MGTDADLDWMDIKSDKKGGCRANVGFLGPGFGPHLFNLERGTFCVKDKGATIHEALHVMGGEHEQSRPDRQRFIKILWDKIPIDSAHNYWRTSWTSEDAA